MNFPNELLKADLCSVDWPRNFKRWFVRGRHGGEKKRGVENLTNDTPPPSKTCANPQTRDQNIKRANFYENEIVLNISRFKLFRSIS